MNTNAIAAVALCALLAVPPPAAAQTPRVPQWPALTAEGCAIAADMVLVARSLAAEKIERAAASRVMALAYAAYSGSGGALDRLREELIDFAYTRSEVPLDLSRVIYSACVQSGGRRGALFGTRIRWRP